MQFLTAVTYIISVIGIQVFLSESAPKLQKVFDSSCGFWNVQSVLMDHTERMVETVTNLRSNTRLLCGLGTEEFTESCMLLTRYNVDNVLNAC